MLISYSIHHRYHAMVICYLYYNALHTNTYSNIHVYLHLSYTTKYDFATIYTTTRDLTHWDPSNISKQNCRQHFKSISLHENFSIQLQFQLAISQHWFRDHFVYAPSKWETKLHCNVISHWLGAYTKWSLLVEVMACHYLTTCWIRSRTIWCPQATMS